MNTVVDIGNTAIKIGFFEKDKLIEKHIIQSMEEMIELIHIKKNKHILFSSVKIPISSFLQKIDSDIQTFELSSSTKLPFENEYKTKDTLGMDRLAAIAGAHQLFPNHHSLVVDVGTAIKFDFISNENKYKGGGISPGLAIRFKSLHQFTSQLPLLASEKIDYLIGNSTSECIMSGVMNGTIAEINGIIEQYKDTFDELKIILTGGDASFFETRIKHSIFVEPDLVLKGLNYLLQYNV